MAAHDPPASVREKGDRVVIVFNVANARPGSVTVKYHPGSGEGAGDALFVAFSSVSPTRKYEKHLELPNAVQQHRIVSDVQGKCVTVQLTKVDPLQSWGSAWIRPSKASKKGKQGHKPNAPALTSPHVQEPDERPFVASCAEDIQEPASKHEDTRFLQGSDKNSELHLQNDSTCKSQPGTRLQDDSSRADLELKQDPSNASSESQQIGAAPCSVETRDIQSPQKTSKSAPAAAGAPPSKKQSKAVESATTEAMPSTSESAKVVSIEAATSSAPSTPSTRKPRTSASNAATLSMAQCSNITMAAPVTVQDKSTPTFQGQDTLATDTGTCSKTKARRSRSKKKQLQDDVMNSSNNKEIGKPKTAAPQDHPLRDDKGCLPVLPPSDPKTAELVKEGMNLFDKDERKAVVLFRLAARRGYTPANLLLAQLAKNAGKETIMIDALFSLLASKECKQQLLPELLEQCVVQLAAALQDPQHAEELRNRRKQLEELASVWPLLALACVKMECRGPKIAHKSQARSRDNEIAYPVDSSKVMSTSCIGFPESESKPSKIVTAPEKHDSWQKTESGWRLDVGIPALKSLADGDLEISGLGIRLRGPDGTTLLDEVVPKGSEASKAQATWSKRNRKLTIDVPNASMYTMHPQGSKPSTSCEVGDEKKTPENLSRLTPKLRERLVEKRILSREDTDRIYAQGSQTPNEGTSVAKLFSLSHLRTPGRAMDEMD